MASMEKIKTRVILREGSRRVFYSEKKLGRYSKERKHKNVFFGAKGNERTSIEIFCEEKFIADPSKGHL